METTNARWIALACVIASACAMHDPPPQPCTRVVERSGLTINVIDRVDLLFVIDTSSSMGEEQASLARELPTMIAILASGDFDQDGDLDDAEDFEPILDLHVGVITTDMGAGGHAVPTCTEPDFGDDGVLPTEGRAGVEGCEASYPSFLRFEPQSRGAAERFVQHMTCVAAFETDGCGVEQPLEAMLKALSPAARQPWTSADYRPPGDFLAPDGLTRPFFRGTSPHGDGANDGFARERSVLAIVPITDEDDCSLADADLFAPDGPYAGTELALRCFAHPEALHPVERYVNGLLQLRQRPQLLVYAPIVGIPVDLAPPLGAAPDWDRLASEDCDARDPRLCERVDPAMENLLVPSCSVAARGLAFPPTRTLQVARELAARGAGVTVQSICQESYADALGEILRLIRPGVRAACLARPLYVGPDGRTPCELEVLLPPGVTCDEHGYAAVIDDAGAPVREDDRALCALRQLVAESREPGAPAPDGVGWYYDDFSLEVDRTCGTSALELPRVQFAGTRPPSFSEVRFECSTPLDAVASGFGAPCDAALAGACADLRTIHDAPLACDPLRGSCGVSCEDDRDCDRAGLASFACDRPWRAGVVSSSAPGGFCVSPSCE